MGIFHEINWNKRSSYWASPGTPMTWEPPCRHCCPWSPCRSSDSNPLSSWAPWSHHHRWQWNLRLGPPFWHGEDVVFWPEKKNIGVLKQLKTFHIHQQHLQINVELFLSSPESQVPPKDPIRLSKDSLWRFGAIETQRHNPTFFGSKICLTHLCPLSAWEWTALSHPKIYPDTDCLPFQRWIVSIFFCLFSLLSWLLTKRVNSICAWLTAACWKFQEQVKSVAPRASHQERVARRII